MAEQAPEALEPLDHWINRANGKMAVSRGKMARDSYHKRGFKMVRPRVFAQYAKDQAAKQKAKKNG
ncbi:hypothetical protein DDSR119_53 [Pseudomonas phage DDSR119]|nr:hypothetical protein DDSR119_53 [Pseudomonas phage DDSR119]